MDRAGVRWPDSLAESSQDRRRAVLHHHHRGTPALGGLHPQVLLHAGPPGDEGRRPARRQLQPVGRQAHRRAARRYRRPLRQCGAGQGRCRSGALHQPGRDLPGPGGRPPRRHLRRLHPAADRLPRYPARQGLRLRRAGVQGPKYFGEGAGIAVRKGDAELVGKLNAAIDAIRADGTYKRIEGKYFKSDIYGD
ncbi:transporter substrate-binding domain-containing protein [Pseudomonas aeruginosa]